MRATAEPAGWPSLAIVASGSLLATAAIPLAGPQLRNGAGASRAANARALSPGAVSIYAAYLLIVGGFLAAHLSWWNGVVALIWLWVQVARIQREETLLRSDEHYQDYVRQVRWRSCWDCGDSLYASSRDFRSHFCGWHARPGRSARLRGTPSPAGWHQVAAAGRSLTPGLLGLPAVLQQVPWVCLSELGDL